MREMILWGLHPAHGNEPIKLSAYTPKERTARQLAGWTCEVMPQGEEPVGLLGIAKARHGQSAETRGRQELSDVAKPAHDAKRSQGR